MLCYEIGTTGRFFIDGKWYIGAPAPELTHALGNGEFFVVQASGSELDYIQDTFSIPTRTSADKKVIVWRGETARFILENLT